MLMDTGMSSSGLPSMVTASCPRARPISTGDGLGEPLSRGVDDLPSRPSRGAEHLCANLSGIPMPLVKEQKSALIGDYRRSETDTGSPEVQVALLTKRIEELTEHLRTH